jgi:hypothetical protein
MQKQAGILDRVTLPTRIIVKRMELTAAALAQVLQSGELSPADGGVCELEAGGQVLARGRIVKRGGKFWFKVTEAAEGGKQ